MKFFSEFKKLVNPYGGRDDDEYEYEEDEEPIDEEPEQQPEPYPASGYGRPAVGTAAPVSSEPRPVSNRVSAIHGGGQMQIVLFAPKEYPGVNEIGDCLRANKAVMLNVKKTDIHTTRRVVDFMSGCAYALDGKIKKVADYAFLITPRNVDVVGKAEEDEQEVDESTNF
ncbi:MAG: cell division protein SepF [Oscillospiraceae bacterium]|nr:cell division protein SepF [Oscillospiraceae bacterium]